jgi:hypothetical protein
VGVVDGVALGAAVGVGASVAAALAVADTDAVDGLAPGRTAAGVHAMSAQAMTATTARTFTA